MKSSIFEKEINYINDYRIKESLKTMIELLPDYFFEVGASSTGKYHPSFSIGKGGLVRHTKSAVRIAVELFADAALQRFTDHQKDLIIFSIVIHDGLKYGLVKNDYTKFDHPLLISKYLSDNMDKLKLSDDEIITIKECVETHMGPWVYDYNKIKVLDYPKTEEQKFVHLCDYLSSRRFLDIKFINNNIED